MPQNKLLQSSPITALREHFWRWAGPALGIALAVTAYAAIRPNTWEATQALILRNQATNNQHGPGKFREVDDMKLKQETVLELATSRPVLAKALEVVGPPRGKTATAKWPTSEDVSTLQESIRIVAPNGAEFGKTEVFYLKVKDHDRQRAIALATAICDQMQSRFQNLLRDQAESMTAELEKSTMLAAADLQQATDRLAALENQVGADLVELRALNGGTGAESDLRRKAISLETELREAEQAAQVNEELLNVLNAAQNDPGRLVAAPNRLLESQPALKRLKDGLIDAQLRTAELSGTMSDAHPKVQASLIAEQEIGEHLHDELPVAIRGVEVELRLNSLRIKSLKEQLDQAHARLGRLAGLRAEYATLLANVAHRTQLLEQAERNLGEARGSQAAALASSLIDRIDVATTGDYPVGPSRSQLVLAGVAAGLFGGFGLVFLTVPMVPGGPLVSIGSPRGNRGSESHPSESTPVAASGSLSLKQALGTIEGRGSKPV